LTAFALVTFLLTLSAAPARSSEPITADDTARFLAGLPVSSKSPLAPFTSDPVWLWHARNLNSAFAREESAQLALAPAGCFERLAGRVNLPLS
jgi:hypothetical protein